MDSPSTCQERLQYRHIDQGQKGSLLMNGSGEDERLWSYLAHFPHSTGACIQKMNTGVKVWLKSSCRQNSFQETIVYPIKDLGLVQIDQHGFFDDFFCDCANQMKDILDHPALYSTIIFKIFNCVIVKIWKLLIPSPPCLFLHSSFITHLMKCEGIVCCSIQCWR